MGALPAEPEVFVAPALATSLVLAPLGKYARSAEFADPVLAALAGDPLWSPSEGVTMSSVDGRSAAWTPATVSAAGVLEGDASSNSWWFQRWSHVRDEVLLLECPGAAVVYANATPRMGDLYRLGSVRIPVALRAGDNELLVRVGRGEPSAVWSRPPAPVFLAAFDRTLPDVILGESGALLCAVVVVNASELPVSGLRIATTLGGGELRSTPLEPLLPLEARKVPVVLAPPAQSSGESLRAELQLESEHGARLHADAFELAVRRPTQHHARTFASRIDRSVQYYAVVPAASPAAAAPAPEAAPTSSAAAESAAPALILSLHGASVEARGQAAAYAAKDWAWIVAPTNRRPYGFDWEDWGRRDALEVLELALSGAAARDASGRGVSFDPARVYLTGHSMGGHGTWQIGARYAGRFAAIAPSAGWSDFWSYIGSAVEPPADPIGALLQRASNGSRTLLWARNYAQHGVYVLHGDADDNVPVREARRMREELGRFHPDFAYFEQPGAGHWWGNECVDWPPLMEFLRRHRLASKRSATEAEVRLVDLDAERTSGFATLVAQTRPLIHSELKARAVAAERRFEVETLNVDALELSSHELVRGELHARWEEWSESESALALVDGVEVELPSSRRSAAGAWRLWRSAGTWALAPGADVAPRRKHPGAAGPFKEAFDFGFVLVYGTAGTPEENAWAIAKARFDADQFRYRGNASPLTLSDHELLERRRASDGELTGRNVVLYGHSKSNTAWNLLVDAAAFDVAPGWVRAGSHSFEGDDLSVLAVRPSATEPNRLVAVVSGTGVRGMRALNHAPYFVSGAGFPDWWVARSSFLARGIGEHLGAGFFRADWSVDDGADTVARPSLHTEQRGR